MAIDYVLHWTDDSLKEPFKLKTQSTNSTKTSLTLSGRGALNWGENLQANMLRMLENFASKETPPKNPTIGQLWFNTQSNYLRIWWQGRWNDIGYNRIDSAVPPAGPYFSGDLWYDTVADKLKVYDNNGTWDATYQGGIPVPAPLPTPTPVVPTPVPGTPTSPTPLPPGTPSPTPTSPTPTPSPASPTPTPSPVAPTPVPAPTPVTPTPVTPTVPAPTVPVPNPIPPGLTILSPQFIDNGTYDVRLTYNGPTGTGEINDVLPYIILATDLSNQTIKSAAGSIRRVNGEFIIAKFNKPTLPTTISISGGINNVPSATRTIQFLQAVTPVPSTTANGKPGPVGQDASKFEMIWNDEFDVASVPGNTGVKWMNSMWYESPNLTVNYNVSNSCLRIWPAYDTQGKLFNRDFTTDNGIYYATYGFIEWRAKLPRGKGLQPSIWMYNRDVDPYGNSVRPEIDVMNAFCSGGIDAGWSDAANVPTAFESIVLPNSAGVAGSIQKRSTTLSTNFHTYGIRWVPGNMKFYLDGQLYYDLNVSIENRMFFVLSLRIGTVFSVGGAPDNSTQVGPAGMGVFEIDYVRHWTIKN